MKRKEEGEAVVLTPSEASEHPFEADPRDHAETPFEAYRDIAPLLRFLAERLYGRGAADAQERLRIYDPYYCEGSMKVHMARLGFPQVYNRNEDFYAMAAAGSVPEFDVLVTNPPFSGDHMERIIQWAEQCGKPWFILMPHYVANKPFYHRHLKRCYRDKKPDRTIGIMDDQPGSLAAEKTSLPMYLAPTKRAYVFTAPVCSSDDVGQRMMIARGSSEASKDVVQALPAGFFQCIWFIQLGPKHARHVLSRWQDECEGRPSIEATIAGDAKLLPQLTLVKRPTPAERRWRKKQRLLAASEGPPAPDRLERQMTGGIDRAQGRGIPTPSEHRDPKNCCRPGRLCPTEQQAGTQPQGERKKKRRR